MIIAAPARINQRLPIYINIYLTPNNLKPLITPHGTAVNTTGTSIA